MRLTLDPGTLKEPFYLESKCFSMIDNYMLFKMEKMFKSLFFLHFH